MCVCLSLRTGQKVKSEDLSSPWEVFHGSLLYCCNNKNNNNETKEQDNHNWYS
jgi:hypothetical protein